MMIDPINLIKWSFHWVVWNITNNNQYAFYMKFNGELMICTIRLTHWGCLTMCFCFSLCWHVLFVFVGASVSSYMRCHPPLIVIPISLGGKQNIVHISYIPIPWPQICVFPNIQQFLRVILRVYIYMCIYIFEYTYTYVYIYIYIRIHVHVRVFHYVLIHIP
jgi:hypothetical protein